MNDNEDQNEQEDQEQEDQPDQDAEEHQRRLDRNKRTWGFLKNPFDIC